MIPLGIVKGRHRLPAFHVMMVALALVTRITITIFLS